MVKIIMKDDTIKELNGYDDIPEYIGHELVFYGEYGSYQGDWIMVSKKEDTIYLWRGGYGSCSGCDHFQDWEYGRGDASDERQQKSGDEFVYAYSPEEEYNISSITEDIIFEYIKRQKLEEEYKEINDINLRKISKEIKDKIDLFK